VSEAELQDEAARLRQDAVERGFDYMVQVPYTTTHMSGTYTPTRFMMLSAGAL
jgi:hypothetical protein